MNDAVVKLSWSVVVPPYSSSLHFQLDLPFSQQLQLSIQMVESRHKDFNHYFSSSLGDLKS